MRHYYIKFILLLTNYWAYVIIHVMLLIILRVIVIKTCFCEPDITVEYVKSPVLVNQNDYTKMDPMYTTVEEQLNTRIDSNRKLVWNSDGTASLIFIKEDITTKIASHYEAAEYLQRERNKIANVPPIIKKQPIISEMYNSVKLQDMLNNFDYESFYTKFLFGAGNFDTKTMMSDFVIPYMKNNLPQELLSKSEIEITNPNAPINQFIDKFFENVRMDTKEHRILFSHLQAAISTYNTGHLLNCLDNKLIVNDIFKKTLERILKFYE